MHVTHELKVQFGSEKVDIETFNSKVHYVRGQGVFWCDFDVILM